MSISEVFINRLQGSTDNKPIKTPENWIEIKNQIWQSPSKTTTSKSTEEAKKYPKSKNSMLINEEAEIFFKKNNCDKKAVLKDKQGMVDQLLKIMFKCKACNRENSTFFCENRCRKNGNEFQSKCNRCKTFKHSSLFPFILKNTIRNMTCDICRDVKLNGAIRKRKELNPKIIQKTTQRLHYLEKKKEENSGERSDKKRIVCENVEEYNEHRINELDSEGDYDRNEFNDHLKIVRYYDTSQEQNTAFEE